MTDIGVFPALPGLAWNVTKTPTFQTRIQRAVSGRELRALDYPYPLWQFTLVFDFLRDSPAAGLNELRKLIGFFLLCQGAYATFLYQDPFDNQVTGQSLGTGDSSTTAWQLQRTLGDASLAGGGFTEPVLAPNQVSAIYFNGITQPATSYSVDAATGIVTFVTPPPYGAAITADFTYYFRCRFSDDSYDFTNFMLSLWELKKLTFISVRP
jgi:uncharacterized protein (TIGR02217 family)